MSHLLYIIAGITLFLSCKGGNKSSKPEKQPPPVVETAASEAPRTVQSIQFVSPSKHDTCRFNEALKIVYANNKRFPVDSAQLFFNNNYITTLDSNTREYTLTLPEGKCGSNTIRITAFHPGGKKGSATQFIILKPDKAPWRLNYEIVNTYHHDYGASTQGLVYHEGYMYEGTGIRGESSLRKIDLERNKVLEMLSLDGNLFGEGITIYRDKIYQITWTDRKGFVYDIKTFKEENTFNYTTQGWGITTMGDKLVMSDGSNQLYHLNPEGFHKIKTVEVYDHNGPVVNLNELEYINGYIWANVWLTDRIVIIHPETGAVTEELFLPNMLTPAEKAKIDLKEDVLNGIAYNPDKGTVYVTGKRWPKILELKISR